MKYFIYLLPLIILITQCRNKEEKYISLFPGKPFHKNANAEEEVFFPAPMLVGAYLELKSVRDQ